MNNVQEKKENAPILSGDYKVTNVFHVRIPQCCRDGWENCPHVVQRLKARKGNIGL